MIRVLEPATEEVLAEVPQAGVEETDEAVARAKEAFLEWRSVAPGERAEVLHRLADALGERRDPDVQLEALQAIEAAMGEADRPGLEAFADRERADQARGNERVAGALGVAEEHDLQGRLKALVAEAT